MAINKKKVTDAARKAAAKGQYDKAIKEYLKLVKDSPSDTRTWMKIGDLYSKKGATEKAVETYTRVATDYTEQGFYLKAIAVYKQVIKVDPSLIEINLKLAELYRQLGLLSEAMQHFEMVASHFHREGKTEEALATIRQLVELDPENVATRIKLAELYSKESMKEKAIEEFERACEQLKAESRQDDYVKVAERLLWHKPEDTETARELARIYLRRNDSRRALQKLQLCFKKNPKEIPTLELLVEAFQSLDQTEKMVSVLKELARILGEEGNMAEAEKAHRRILSLTPEDQESRAFMGMTASKPAEQPVQLPPEMTETPPPQILGRTTGSLPLLEDESLSTQPIDDESYIDELALDDSEILEIADIELIEDDDLLVADDSLSGVEVESVGEEKSEPIAAAEPAGGAEGIAKMLADADVFIRYGLHKKAIDQLRQVFDLDSSNIEAREKLKEVYLSQGREDEAVNEILTLAEQTLSSDKERGANYLREALSLDAGCARAFDLAKQNDVDLSGVSVEEVRLEDSAVEAAEAPQEMEFPESGDELEMEFPEPAVSAQQTPATEFVDEPSALRFDAADAAAFDKEAEVAHASSKVNKVPEFVEQAPAALIPDREADVDLAFQHSASAQGTQSEPAISDELAEELEEADFFLAQGLVEEARDILEGLLEENPNHSSILAKLREVDSKVEDDPGIDSSQHKVQKPVVMLEEALDDSDAEAHYDLGMAYKEMGLWGEAIKAFTKVAGTPGRRVQCHVMIGLCNREKGDLSEAINQFKAGLYVDEITEAEQFSLYYEIGATYESQNDPEEALYYLEMISKKDSSYRDVSKRIPELREKAQAKSHQEVDSENFLPDAP